MSLEWRDDLAAAEWDRALAELGGHPLQSAHWGNARQKAEGLNSVYLAGFQKAHPLWLGRAEIRRIPLLGAVAWLPKGPVCGVPCNEGLERAAHEQLKARGFIAAASNPWNSKSPVTRPDPERSPRTVWIDLEQDTAVLLGNLDKQWRYGVRCAQRSGVEVVQTTAPVDSGWFFSECLSISQAKGFELPASRRLMEALLEDRGDIVESRLFVARYEGAPAAGAFIIRCGQSMHYFWGAMDRRFSRQRPGEALQWAAIEWGKHVGCTLYDLEGIDPDSNPGVYAFKKKMGGDEVCLSPVYLLALTQRGRLVVSTSRLPFLRPD